MDLRCRQLLIVLIVLIQSSAFAQKLSSLFVHFDKTVYTQNETVWFTGYLMRSEVDLSVHHTLSVALIRNDNGMIAIEERFVMEGGLAFGNITLPDSIPPGTYHFAAYTNMVKDSIPIADFYQPITIKTNENQTFEATLSLDTLSNKEFMRVTVNTRNKVFQRIPGAEVKYCLGRSTAISIKPNKVGQHVIEIPKKQVTSHNNILIAEIRHEKEVKHVSIRLPVAREKLSVRFYPEGGDLLADHINKVGWEVKSSGGQPIGIVGLLLENNKIIDTISTMAYGLGNFKFTPKADALYSVRFDNLRTDLEVEFQYALPQANRTGLVCALEKAIVNDTLVLYALSNRPRKVKLKIHDNGSTFAAQELLVSTRPRKVKIALRDVPRGLTALTLEDESGPLWERLFFANYERKPTLTISTDEEKYKVRQKVKMNLGLILTDSLSIDSLKGIFSIAVVQANRIESANQTTIQNHFDLVSQIGTIPLNPMGIIADDRSYLENILLVKGWRRYSIDQSESKASPESVFSNYRSLEFKGKIASRGKPPRKPVPLAIVGGEGLRFLEGDSLGNVRLSREDLLVADGKKLLFVAGEKSAGGFTFAMEDPYRSFNEHYAKVMPVRPTLLTYEQTSENNVLPGSERAIELKEVGIKKQKDNSFYRMKTLNSCFDYVCEYNILNCRNHPGGRPAVNGEVYQTASGPRKYFCSEQESQPSLSAFKGINLHAEFYGSDYEKLNPTESEYLSTIYWNHSMRLSSLRQAEVTFYTSDITGTFKVIVQGITNKGVVYGEREFEVLK